MNAIVRSQSATISPANRLPQLSDAEANEREREDVRKAWLALRKAVDSFDRESLEHAIAIASDFLDPDNFAGARKSFFEAAREATVGEIAKQVALMVAGFAAGRKQSAVYVELLSEDVAAAEPTIGALTAAVRRLRRTWKPEFGRELPSVAEVLEALAEEEGKVERSSRLLLELPDLCEKARRRRAEVIESHERWERNTLADIRRRIDRQKNSLDELRRMFPSRLVDQVIAEDGLEVAAAPPLSGPGGGPKTQDA